jgi:hypothetical protein
MWGAAKPTNSGERCPGEENCERFGSQGGDGITHAEQEIAACTSCSLKGTKPGKFSKSDLIGSIVNSIVRLAQRRDSGYGIQDLTALESELLLTYDAEHAHYHRVAAQLKFS